MSTSNCISCVVGRYFGWKMSTSSILNAALSSLGSPRSEACSVMTWRPYKNNFDYTYFSETCLFSASKCHLFNQTDVGCHVCLHGSLQDGKDIAYCWGGEWACVVIVLVCTLLVEDQEARLQGRRQIRKFGEVQGRWTSHLQKKGCAHLQYRIPLWIRIYTSFFIRGGLGKK